MILGELAAVILRVTDTLEALLIPYAIGGSVASITYGEIRLTQDVDIVARIQETHVAPLIAQLGSEFYADVTMMTAAIAHQSSFNLIHFETMFKVDIFAAHTLFDEQQLKRSRKRIISQPDRAAYIASAEDTILAKLRWYRMGGETSERQWRDVTGIVNVQGGRLDWTYMRETAVPLKISDLLTQLWETTR